MPRRMPFILTLFTLLTITIWGAYQAADFLIPLSFAALLSFMMLPLVRGFNRVKLPEWIGILLSVVLVLAPLFTLGYFLSREVENFLHHGPAMMEALQKHWDELVQTPLGTRLHLDRILQGTTLRQRLEAETSNVFRILLQGLHALLSTGSEILLVTLLAVVMVISRNSLLRGMNQAFRVWDMAGSPAIVDESIALIEQFLIARLSIVLFVAIADLVILKIFGVNFFVLLAVMMGIMTLIPAVGFIISLAPTLLISLLSGNSILKTVFLFAGLAVVSIIESNVLTPMWVGKRINLNLLATFIGLFAGERLWGVPGMFLSLPLLAILRIILSATPETKPLGDLLSERETPESKEPKKKAA